jgi:Mg2+ and Co2+ transporter CorA
VERLAAEGPTVRRPGLALTPTRRLSELRELIAALDRRVPRLERTGEESIASEAAALRVEALKQIADLQDDIVTVVRSATQAQQTATAG